MSFERLVEIAGLETTIVGHPEDARIVVVLLHGFAMQPGDLSPFAHSLGVRGLFFFPRGPVTAAASPAGRAWWQIDPVARATALARGPRDFATEHPIGLVEARLQLWRFLDELKSGGFLPLDIPLVLGGFSQGGMLVCDALVREDLGPRAHPRIDALVLLSASRIAFDEWRPFLAAGAVGVQGLPAFISHGLSDPDLAFAAGEALRDCLTNAGALPTWIPFDQGHEIPLPVWRHLRKFLLERCVPA